MRLLKPRPNHGPGRAIRGRWSFWVLAIGAGVLTALIGFPSAESAFRQLKYAVHRHDPSGQIAIVEIDDRSIAALGRWPIPRGVYARLIDILFAQRASSVTLDIDLSNASTSREDALLAAAIKTHSGKVTLEGSIVPDPISGQPMVLAPLSIFPVGGNITSGSFPTGTNNEIYSLPYAVTVRGHVSPEIATSLARYSITYSFDPRSREIFQGPLKRIIPDKSFYYIDGSINQKNIPHLSLIDVLSDPRIASGFNGKRVLVGISSEQVSSTYIVPPYGRVSGARLQAIGAETLIDGTPIDIGALPAILLSILAVGWAGVFKKNTSSTFFLLAAGLTTIAIYVVLPRNLTCDIMPAIAICLVASMLQAVAVVKDAVRRRATTNQISGLLNLTALRSLPLQPGTRLVVTHIHNFAEATATMPPSSEAALIAQIASRLRLAMTDRALYHGDNGVFSWISSESVIEIGERLDALHALFRSGVTIEQRVLDLVVTFGVDDDADRSIANRLGSALVAAAEAHAEGVRWREFNKSKLADTAWKLSMLSELDAAIEDGTLWVAYQPKLDLRTRRIVGAEALVRWSHPEKGAISPIEFIAAAEQHNRIEKLTVHVLERAILAAATINAHDIDFGIAVNLSARLLDVAGLVDQIGTILVRHGLAPERLTLEVTETASLATEHSLDALHELRNLGVHISIDDYGTGLSTLEYLRKIPAGEIKVDRSFVQEILSSASDLLMVNSTIQLAHSLGHSVVAEGVESADILARLVDLGCDVAQGYHIGRPMAFQDLARRLLGERRHVA